MNITLAEETYNNSPTRHGYEFTSTDLTADVSDTIHMKPNEPEVLDTKQSNDTPSQLKVLHIEDSDDFTGDSGYLAMRKDALVNLTDIYPKPETCLSIEQNGIDVPFGSMGEFSLVTGKAKSRKTFLSTMIVAQTLLKRRTGKDHVLIFDTEQSGYRVHKNGLKILNLTNDNMISKIRLFRLRRYSPKERVKFIEQELENKTNTKVGLVVIDGIRDLVTSINDEFQAAEISSLLLKWSEKYSFHIMVILHQNKGDNNARGHLGSELVNKSECVLSVAIDGTDNTNSIIKCDFSRNQPFKEFFMGIDEQGLPYHFLDDRGPKVRTHKIPNPADVKVETQNEILTDIFKNNTLQYGELVLVAKSALEKHGMKMGDNKTKDFITYWKEKELIIKNGTEYSINV